MPKIRLAERLSLDCAVDDHLWPWEAPTPALHGCFEPVDVEPILASIRVPVLLLSGDKNRIASEQQKILAESLPHGRLELFAGYGHGVNLFQPERCARTALDFWRTLETERQAK
jgi:pimeloyl-ACP methyl ester carboxylesterase